MDLNSDLINRIRFTVKSSEPKATVIVYGSFARGENNPHSDIDLLILLNKDKVTRADKKK